MAQALQSPDHIYYGRYLTSEPPSGLRQVNQTGFGLFNGGGFLPPPPRPGAHILTGEVGQSTSVRLGELFQHGGSGEVGEGATQSGTGLPVVSSPWLPPAAENMDGLTFISYIPRPDDGSHTNLEIPANQLFFANQTATNFSVTIGNQVSLQNQTSNQQQGVHSTTTNRLMGEIALREAIASYQHLYSGIGGVNLLDTSQTLNQIQPAPEQETTWLDILEKLIDLPIGNENFREVVYCLLQNLAQDAWSGTGDNPVSDLQQILSEAVPEELTKVLAQLNKWLPLALKIKDLIFSGDKKAATVGEASIDLDTLDITIDITDAIAKLNDALGEKVIVLQDQTLTICEYTITPQDVFETLPADLVSCLSGLNRRLPSELKFKTYGTQRVTAVRITPGLFISEGQALQLQTKIGNPVEIAVDQLRCQVPVVADLMNISMNSQAVHSTPISIADFLAGIQTVFGIIEDPEQALSQLKNFLPAELQDLLTLEGNSIYLNPIALMDYGVAELNRRLPSQLQLGVEMDGNRISGASLGPVSISIADGEMQIGLDISKVIGGLEIQSYIDLLPEGELRALLSSTVLEVKLPYDDLEEDSTEETINQGGYLGDWPELNILNNRQGSPIPLLLSTLECLSSLPGDPSVSPTTPLTNDPNITIPSPSCYAVGDSGTRRVLENLKSQSPDANGPGDRQSNQPFDMADPSQWPSQVIDRLRQIPLPNQSLPASRRSTISDPLKRELDRLGVPNAPTVVEKAESFVQDPSLFNLLDLVASYTPTSTKMALAKALDDLGADTEALKSTIDSACTEDALFELSDTDFFKALLYGELSAAELIADPVQLVSWLNQNEPQWAGPTQYLLFGELPEFFEQLVFSSTGHWLAAHPNTQKRLERLVRARFGYPL